MVIKKLIKKIHPLKKGDHFQIGILATKGGTGKTTIAYAVGKVLKSHGCCVFYEDLDPQGSLKNTLNIAGEAIQGVGKGPTFVIYDTPAYRCETTRALLKKLDLILIPIKTGTFDLLALNGLSKDLKAKDALVNSLIVLTHVWRSNPLPRKARNFKELLRSNYAIPIANTAIPSLKAFQTICFEPTSASSVEERKKALQHVQTLLEEAFTYKLNTTKNNPRHDEKKFKE